MTVRSLFEPSLQTIYPEKFLPKMGQGVLVIADSNHMLYDQLAWRDESGFHWYYIDNGDDEWSYFSHYPIEQFTDLVFDSIHNISDIIIFDL